MLHIYPICRIFYLPSIDTGTRVSQFNVSSELHPAGILLTEVVVKVKVLHLEIELGTSSAAGKHLNY